MAEDEKVKESTQFKWVKSEKGIVDLYGNIIHPTWTLFDVRLVVGQLMGVRGDPVGKGFVVEEQGGITLSWPQVKVLRGMLDALVKAYEEANGEIKPINLARPASLLQQQKSQT